jgi:hypothetical protein
MAPALLSWWSYRQVPDREGSKRSAANWPSEESLPRESSTVSLFTE